MLKMKLVQLVCNKIQSILKNNNIDYISLIVAKNTSGSTWRSSTHKKQKRETFIGDGGPYRIISQ